MVSEKFQINSLLLVLVKESDFCIKSLQVKSSRRKSWVASRLYTGTLLSLTNINYLHLATKYYEGCHFIDDANFLNYDSCVKSINK